jgi:hypothetical protein
MEGSGLARNVLRLNFWRSFVEFSLLHSFPLWMPLAKNEPMTSSARRVAFVVTGLDERNYKRFLSHTAFYCHLCFVWKAFECKGTVKKISSDTVTRVSHQLEIMMMRRDLRVRAHVRFVSVS